MTFRDRQRRLLHSRLARLAVGTLAAAALIGVVVFSRQDNSPRGNFERGLAALRENDLAQALRAAHALDEEPDFVEHARLLRGALSLRRGDLESALRQLSQIRPQGELRIPALLAAGECLYHLGRLEEAEPLLVQLAREQPRNPQARRWLAAVCYDLGRLDRALAELGELARLEPRDFACWRLMGKIYREDLHDHTEAVRCYRQALRLDPPHSERDSVVRELSHALIEYGRYQEALGSLEWAEPGCEVLALKAQCQWNLGRREDARKSLSQAEEIDADHRTVLMLQAQMRQDEGDLAAAVAPLRRVLKGDPHDFPCRYQLALVLQRLGDAAASEAEMVKMERSKQFRDRLAELFFEARRLDNPDAREEIAQLCREHGVRHVAEIWERAAEASRNSDQIAALGSEWYRQSGADDQQRTSSTR